MARSGSLKDLGSHFQAAWKRLLEDPAVQIRRPTELSRAWKLEQTLCTRIFQALAESDPTSALPKLPAITSLRAVLNRARRSSAPEKLVSAADEAVDALEQAIHLAGGSKSNLDVLCARHQRHAREKVERTAKQQIFRGMASLLGVQAKVSYVQVYLYPSADEGWCDELAVHGFLGLRRFRPELPVLLGVRETVPNDDGQLGVVLRSMLGEEIDSRGLMTAVQPFCSSPMPEVSFKEEDGKLLYLLAESKQDLIGEVDLCFGSIQRRGEPLFAKPGHERARFAFVPSTPSEQVVFDLFVHKDVLPGQSPECVLLKTGDPSAPDLASHSLDRLDLVENIRDLGTDPSAIPIQAAPRQLELVEHLHQRMGWQMGDFRLHRLAVRHPVMGVWYSMQFPLPKA